MELTVHLSFNSSTILSNYVLSTYQTVQTISAKHISQSSICRMQYFASRNKSFATPATLFSKSELKNEVRVLSQRAQSSEDYNVLSLSGKPNRIIRDDEDDNEDIGSDDFSYGPDHRSGYVAVIGKPNVGKSTLMNEMIGQKISIVTDKPQTTRHRILGLCSAPDYQMILYDTPGVIQKKMHKLDSMMMKNVHMATVDAECVLIVVDACKIPEKVSMEIDDMLEEDISQTKEKVPTLLVLNKKDLVKPGEIAKKVEWYGKFGGADHVLPISAKYGNGVEDVKNWIVSKLPHGPPYYPKDIISEHPERFFVAEIVREKIFMQYRQEIPYACQVNVVRYIARPTSKHFIEVEILVEKEAQKIILIGKEGRSLKILATAARLDIEDFLRKKVYLEVIKNLGILIHSIQIFDLPMHYLVEFPYHLPMVSEVSVKVKSNWRQDKELLEECGYGGNIRA